MHGLHVAWGQSCNNLSQELVLDAVLSDPMQHLRVARLHVHRLPSSSQKSVALEVPVCTCSVEFLLAAGPAEALRPLGAVASGGETARVMLALKAAPASLLAASDNEGECALHSPCLTMHAYICGHL